MCLQLAAQSIKSKHNEGFILRRDATGLISEFVSLRLCSISGGVNSSRGENVGQQLSPTSLSGQSKGFLIDPPHAVLGGAGVEQRPSGPVD